MLLQDKKWSRTTGPAEALSQYACHHNLHISALGFVFWKRPSSWWTKRDHWGRGEHINTFTNIFLKLKKQINKKSHLVLCFSSKWEINFDFCAYNCDRDLFPLNIYLALRKQSLTGTASEFTLTDGHVYFHLITALADSRTPMEITNLCIISCLSNTYSVSHTGFY